MSGAPRSGPPSITGHSVPVGCLLRLMGGSAAAPGSEEVIWGNVRCAVGNQSCKDLYYTVRMYAPPPPRPRLMLSRCAAPTWPRALLSRTSFCAVSQPKQP